MSKNTGKKMALKAYKEKLLEDIKYYDKRIEEVRLNGRKDIFFENSDSSDSENEFTVNAEFGPNLLQMKLQQNMLRTRLQATQELTNVQVMESEIIILTEDPVYQGEPSVSEMGMWREVTAECRVDLVPFCITFFVHQPERSFAPASYRNLHVTAVKAAHAAELSKSILSTVTKPSDAVEILKSYANAHRSRRTTLARLAEKFATTLYMEPMSDGGYHLKCANLLEVSWVLQNKWSPVAPFHHRMKFDLEYMDESYIKIITQTHRQLNDPSIETDERTFLLTKIISTCLEAQGPTQELYESMSSDPETAQSLRKRRTTLDKEPEIPVMKKKKDSEVMAPPKSLPKKAKPKGKENINTATDAKPKKVDKEKKTNKVVDVEKNVALKKNLTEPIISVNIDKNKDKPKIEKAKTDPVINKKVSNNLNTKDNVVFKKSMNNDINGTENSNKDKSKGISAKGKENPTKKPKDKQDDKEIKQKSENLTKIAKNNTNIAKQVKEKVTAKENKKNANENDTEKVSNTKNKINAVKTANAKDHDVKKLDNAVAKVKSGTKTINKVNSAKVVKESAAVKDTEQANVNKPKSIATIKKVNPIKPVKESNKENNQVKKDKVVVANANVEKRESVASLKRKSNLVDKVIDNINVAAAKKPKLSKPGPVNQVNNKNVNKEQISNKPNIVKSSNQNKPKIVNGSFKSPRTTYNGKIIKSSAEKNSKIPQKTSINQDKMTKNLMKISPLKLPAKFKIPANVNKQKSVQKTTNIPRLLKKTSPS